MLLHKQEQALETARQMSVLGEMTSGFAHELNQPLSAIRHYAQGCLIRLRGQDEQHPLLPALEHIDARHNEEPIRCAISGSGSARHRAIRYSPMTGKHQRSRCYPSRLAIITHAPAIPGGSAANADR